MKIGILGTRGIPNRYGGFEQLAEYLAIALTQRGHQVWVYQSSLHPYRKKEYNKVNIIHRYDPENRLGTFGQFIYDFNSILDSRKREFDVILQLGYTSSSVWSFLFPKKARIITNMDGLEWKRSKYSEPVKRFLKHAESIAVKKSDVLIADSMGIQTYLWDKYKAPSTFIAYGAVPFEKGNEKILSSLNLKKQKYFLAISRMEPENNLETIINGYLISKHACPLIIIGSTNNHYGRMLKAKYGSANIRFTGALYDQELLNNLRFYCKLYFHGHSVGGTNPSLLEAMASQAFICAHRNPFNASVLENEAFYFSNRDEIAFEIQRSVLDSTRNEFIARNLSKIKNQYSWKKIANEYEELMKSSLK
jgi:glycosyltransferase involved in cell wall biosynthesis